MNRSRNVHHRKLSIFLVILVLLGLGAAVVAAQTNLDLRQFAWGGVTFKKEGLQGGQIRLLAQENREGNSTASILFTQLSQTYFDADVVNIDIPEHDLQGVFMKRYEPTMDQTVIFGRLVNIPLLEAVPTMWLEKGSGEFLPAAVGEIVVEENQPVAYFMTTLEGDVSGYKTLNFSYDVSVNEKQPNSIYLQVAFSDEEPSL